MLRIKLVRSTVAHQWRTRRVVESLGLRKINQVVEHDDTPAIRGMVHRVKELLHVEEVEGSPTKKKAAAPAAAKTEEAPKKATKAKAATAEAPVASEEKPKKKTAKKAEDN
ncbi:MAG: 50S ribosomal protein L30 [Armatimonadetes bacterium]|nr:50S ribosomal protein L30 [Armatimonadota bacterium]